LGQFKNGEFHGKGTVYFSNKDKYTGEFLKGHLDGFGILKCADGSIYEGQFKNDFCDGKGTFNYSNGDTYIGEFS